MEQVCHELNGNGGSNVVRVRLKGESPDCNPFVAQYPKRLSNRTQESILLLAVYPLHFLEQVKGDT